MSNLLLTSDGRLLSSCDRSSSNSSSDHTVKVWDIERGILLHNLKGHIAGVNNLLLTGDGRLVSSCRSPNRRDISSDISSDHTVKVCNIATGAMLHSLDGHISSIKFMALLSISGYLMTAGGMQLIIWQLDQGRQVAGFTADEPIESYAITPDDEIILGDRLGRVHFLKLVGPK